MADEIGYAEDTNTGGLNAQKKKTARALRLVRSGRSPRNRTRPMAENANEMGGDWMGGGIPGDSYGRSERRPVRILAIYDNGGKSLDRYTVVTDEKWSSGLQLALGLSENPASYNGFSQWNGVQEGEHLGKRVMFESLNGTMQMHIATEVFGRDE